MQTINANNIIEFKLPILGTVQAEEVEIYHVSAGKVQILEIDWDDKSAKFWFTDPLTGIKLVGWDSLEHLTIGKPETANFNLAEYISDI